MFLWPDVASAELFAARATDDPDIRPNARLGDLTCHAQDRKFLCQHYAKAIHEWPATNGLRGFSSIACDRYDFFHECFYVARDGRLVELNVEEARREALRDQHPGLWAHLEWRFEEFYWRYRDRDEAQQLPDVLVEFGTYLGEDLSCAGDLAEPVGYLTLKSDRRTGFASPAERAKLRELVSSDSVGAQWLETMFCQVIVVRDQRTFDRIVGWLQRAQVPRVWAGMAFDFANWPTVRQFTVSSFGVHELPPLELGQAPAHDEARFDYGYKVQPR